MVYALRTFDSDMHVYDPAYLYEKYMNPKWMTASAGKKRAGLDIMAGP